MIFQKLAELAAQSTKGLMLLVTTSTAGQLSVSVLPQGSFDGDKAALANPLQLVGTPAELDLEFANAIDQFTNARKSLQEQLADSLAILEAAKKVSADKAKSALAAKKPAATAIKSKSPQTTSSAASPEDEGEDNEGETGDQNGDVAAVTAAVPAPKKDAFELDL